MDRVEKYDFIYPLMKNIICRFELGKHGQDRAVITAPVTNYT
jgi:hypothetical protein